MSEFDYLFKNCSPSTPLMPEIFLKYGELNLVLDNLPEAKVGFDRARELKPDYWPAYTRWIDVLLKLRQFDQAKALAEQGLQHLPDNAELQTRLAAASRGHPQGTAPQPPKKKAGVGADKKTASVVAATPSK